MITTAIRFAVNEEEVYYYSIETFDAEQATGVSEDELRRSSRELIAYFNSDAPAVNISVEVDGQEEPLFSPREIRHMQDVKDLMSIAFFAQEVALAYVLLYVVGVFIWSGEMPLRTLASQALTACVLTIGVLAVTAALAVSGFESTWESFHEIVFANDLWQLDEDSDRLIQMFPEEFWFRVTLFIGVLGAGPGRDYRRGVTAIPRRGPPSRSSSPLRARDAARRLAAGAAARPAATAAAVGLIAGAEVALAVGPVVALSRARPRDEGKHPLRAGVSLRTRSLLVGTVHRPQHLEFHFAGSTVVFVKWHPASDSLACTARF